MADSPLNRVDPDPGQPDRAAGVPERVRRRYLTEDRPGSAATSYFTDATTRKAAFRDEGRRLTTGRNDPQVVADLVAIAHHRGWAVIQVRGETGFRREAWLQAQSLGLEVRGYRPTERDLQSLGQRSAREAAPASEASQADLRRRDQDRARLRVVETVVEARVRDPTARTRIVASARERIAGWLERGGRAGQARPHGRDRDR